MSNGDQIYLTAQGLEKLKVELIALKAKLREVAERIDKAKELGDLSENAEYHEAKEDYAFTAGKIMEIEDTLNRASVMAEQTQKEVVQMGSTVRVQNGAGKDKEYTLLIGHQNQTKY
ncbi:MAG: transcription elongation factor GreA, partial [Patescibacteria group bacterium]